MLIHWFITLLHWPNHCWIIDLWSHQFMHSLIHWFIGSLNHSCVDSLAHCVSLSHRVIDSLAHANHSLTIAFRNFVWFIGQHWTMSLWIFWFLDSSVHAFTGWFIESLLCCCSCIGSLIHRFIGSLFHGLIGWLIQSISCAWIVSCLFIGIPATTYSFLMHLTPSTAHGLSISTTFL